MPRLPRLRGGGAAGKVLIVIAVEHDGATQLGRVRVGVIDNAGANEPRRFLSENVEPGSGLSTEGLKSYPVVVANTTPTSRST